MQNSPNGPGGASSWERSNVPMRFAEAQKELIADIFDTGIFRQVKSSFYQNSDINIVSYIILG